MSEPRVICLKCGRVEYVKLPPGNDNPDRARKRLTKRHGGCDGKIEYRAGIELRIMPTGQQTNDL